MKVLPRAARTFRSSLVGQVRHSQRPTGCRPHAASSLAGTFRHAGPTPRTTVWARIYVAEFSGGLLASIRQFEDEGAAFAYAAIRVPAQQACGCCNRASDVASPIPGMRRARLWELLHRADEFVYDDRRYMA